MPSFEYVGVRAVLAGVAEFKRDTSTYNSAIDSMVSHINAVADKTVESTKAQAAAWDKFAEQAAAASRAAVGASDAINAKYAENIAILQASSDAYNKETASVIDAEAKKTAAVVDSQSQIIREYQRAAAAAVAAAEAEVKAAETAARSARAQLGAAGGRPTGAPGTLNEVTSFASEAIIAQADAANAKLAETQVALAKVRDEQLAYGATVLQVTTANVAARTEEEASVVASRAVQAAANRDAILSEVQLAAAEQYVADNAAKAALEFEAAEAKKAAAARVAAGLVKAGGAEIAAFEQITRKAIDTTVSFGKALLIISGAGAVGIGAALIAGIKQVADQETALKNIQAVTQGSDAQMKALDQTIQALARTTSTSTENIRLMAVDLARAGINVDQMNAGLLTYVNRLSLASGGELDFKNAAEFVAGTMAQLGLNTAQVPKLVDEVAAAANKTTLSFTDLTAGLRQFLPVGKEFGLNFEQILALIADVGQVMRSGTQAGTGLAQMFVQLLKPTSEATLLLNSHHIAIKNQNGTLRTATEIISDLSAAYGKEAIASGKITQATALQELVHIDNTRALKALLDLIDQGVPIYSALEKVIKDSDGFAQQAADTYQNALIPQLGILKNNLQLNAGLMAQAFLPDLKDMVKSLNASISSGGVVAALSAFSASLRALVTGQGLAQAVAQIRLLTNTFGAGAETGFLDKLVIGLAQVRNEIIIFLLPALGHLRDSIFGVSTDGAQFNTALSTAKFSLIGLVDGASQLINKIAEMITALKNNATVVAFFKDALDNATRIGLVGMGVAALSLLGPLGQLALGVAALSVALTTLDHLQRDQPLLFGAMASAVLALGAAFTTAAIVEKATAAGAAISGLGQALKIIGPSLAGGEAVAGLTAVGVSAGTLAAIIAPASITAVLLWQNVTKAIKDAQFKHGEAVAAIKGDLGDLSKQYNLTGDAAGVYRARTDDELTKLSASVLAHTTADINNLQKEKNWLNELERDVAVAQTTLRYSQGQGDANSNTPLDQNTEVVNRNIAAAQEDKKAQDALAASLGNLAGPGNAGGGAPAAIDNITDAQKKGAEAAKKQIEMLKSEDQAYEGAINSLNQFAEASKNSWAAIATANDEAITKIENNLKRANAAAELAASNQRTEAQRAYTEQRGDMEVAFAQQAADRKAAYDQQIRDMQANFAQQKADLLAQAAFEKGLADEQRAFNEAEKLKSTKLNQDLQTAKVNDTYNDKVAELNAKTNDRMVFAKTAAQKKALLISQQLQKEALDRELQTNLGNLQQQFADQKKQTDLDNQLQADQDAFQEKQSAERAAHEEAQRQQTFDRQLAAAQETYNRQEQAALQSLQRQEAAQDQALARQLQRIADQEAQAKASAKAQHDDALEQQADQLLKAQTAQEVADAKTLKQINDTLKKQFDAFHEKEILTVNDANAAANKLYNQAVEAANAAHQAALQVSAAFKIPPPPPVAISPFIPEVFHEGGIVGGSRGQTVPAYLQAGETVLTPTQVQTLVNQAISVGARTTNSNNSQTFNMHPSYSTLQAPGSLMLDLQALLASSRS